jgi:ferredoxin
MGRKDIIQPSTRTFWREARRIKNFSLFGFFHAYLYGRWMYFYIAVASGCHPLIKRFPFLLHWSQKLIVWIATQGAPDRSIKMEDTYHAKVVPLVAAKQLVSVQEDIHLPNLEKVIPYSIARDIIFKNPDHIVALDCPCRMARENPCLPLDVCLIVGEPFASFVIEHMPSHARWITSEQAQETLIAEDRRGHVHHALFKDVMLDRFYAICNCCSCCCSAIQAQAGGMPLLASSGYVAQVDSELCLKCRKCEKTCQFNAIRMDEKAVIDEAQCMGCGVCVGQCKSGAIRLVRAPARGEPLEIQTLIAECISSK